MINSWHLSKCHLICISKLLHLFDSLLPPQLCFLLLHPSTFEPYANHGVGLRLTTPLN